MTGIRISDQAVDKALGYLKNMDNVAKHAADRAAVSHAEEYIKVVRAEQFLKSDSSKSVAEREHIARASKEHKDALNQWRDCVEADQKNREMVATANLILEIWRTEQANNRRSL